MVNGVARLVKMCRHRSAREAHLINKAMTLEPLGINRRDEQN